MTSSKKTIAIIGAGAAGVMAALRGVLNNDQVLLFTGSGKAKKKSRAQWVRKVENIPGFVSYAQGINDPNKETIKQIQEGPFADNLNLIRKSVSNIEKVNDQFILKDDKGESYEADYVVLATGVMDVQPHINESMKEVFPYSNLQLIDYCIRCDGHHVFGKKTVVIGDNSTAAWVAAMLVERYQVPSMSILTNGKEPDFSESAKELVEIYDMQVETAAITAIEGNPKEVLLNGFVLADGTKVEAEIGFVSLGMIVYNELALQLGASVDDRGFVITNEKGMSNIENFYAVGDIQAGIKKQIYSSWDTAVDSLDDINAKIRTQRREQLLKKYREEQSSRT